MKKEISREQRDRLDRLAAMPDDRIDTSDIPEVLDWSGAVRGGLYRPRKEVITIRVDADILAWFKERAQGRGYQTEINRALRHYISEMRR
jgi:uncharacterized protein (DUF4415 family)